MTIDDLLEKFLGTDPNQVCIIKYYENILYEGTIYNLFYSKSNILDKKVFNSEIELHYRGESTVYPVLIIWA